jgi:hypothetical protein
MNNLNRNGNMIISFLQQYFVVFAMSLLDQPVTICLTRSAERAIIFTSAVLPPLNPVQIAESSEKAQVMQKAKLTKKNLMTSVKRKIS